MAYWECPTHKVVFKDSSEFKTHPCPRCGVECVKVCKPSTNKYYREHKNKWVIPIGEVSKVPNRRNAHA